ncbi:MAG: hypothetical protein JJ992_08525, partial [Planctomycetes bacterium]|nr:hypothetical protein [Planctomycetota bacterium]
RRFREIEKLLDRLTPKAGMRSSVLRVFFISISNSGIIDLPMRMSGFSFVVRAPSLLFPPSR